MVPKPLAMDSHVKSKRFNVGKQRFLKIISQPCLLPFVKIKSVGEIRDKSRQRLSITRSFSAMVIFSNGNVISIFFSIPLNPLNFVFLGDVVNSGQTILAIASAATRKGASDIGTRR